MRILAGSVTSLGLYSYLAMVALSSAVCMYIIIPVVCPALARSIKDDQKTDSRLVCSWCFCIWLSLFDKIVKTVQNYISSVMLVIGATWSIFPHFIGLLGGVLTCYLPGARCRFAYGPADPTATHCLFLQEIQLGFGFTFLVQAHLGDPRQNPESRKTVVVVVVIGLFNGIITF